MPYSKKEIKSEISPCISFKISSLFFDISGGKKLIDCINTESPEKERVKESRENFCRLESISLPDISDDAFPTSKKDEEKSVKSSHENAFDIIPITAEKKII